MTYSNSISEAAVPLFQTASVQLFVYLNLMDFLTTWVGLRMGAAEASPFISWLMGMSSPIMGLMMAKMIGLVLGGLCIVIGKARVIGYANYYFAFLVAWNVYNILLLTARV